jgi:hypothetical protein
MYFWKHEVSYRAAAVAQTDVVCIQLSLKKKKIRLHKTSSKNDYAIH